MGYSVYYKPPKEEMDKIKNEIRTIDFEEMKLIAKSGLIKTCMDPVEDISRFKSVVYYFLSNLYNASSIEAKNLACTQFSEQGEISFHGWDKAQDNVWDSIDELYKVNYENLFIFAIVKTPDYFDDVENYYKKYNDISSCIEEFIESSFTFAQRELMEQFKDYKD